MPRLGVVLAVALLLAACGPDPSAAPAVVAPRDADAPPFLIIWAGDTLLGDAAQPHLDQRGYAWPFAQLADALAADFTVVNLEGPITADATPWDPGQRWSYNAQPESAAALAAAGVDAAGMANNHALDRGPEGVSATVDALAAAGLIGFGAGRDPAAKQPLLIETPHGVVGVVAFEADVDFERRATTHRAGTIAPTAPAVARGIALARAAGARWVVAFVHWGENYTAVDEAQRRAARRFAAAGYDLVVGHGPHHAQPVELIGSMPVFYSLGNFVFGTPGRYGPDAPGYSLLLTTPVGADGIRAAELRCLLTDNRRVRFQPRLCPSAEARAMLAALHPDVELSGDVATLRWR
ncbi:MAG: CapA family protein [Chloroflexi bacterium]|nr:CapA family protein [Chloroflexota bacterium]